MIARLALRLGICLGSVAGIVFLYTYATPARPGVVALTLLLPILLISAAWGVRYALFQCVSSAVVYHYFFVFVFPSADPTLIRWPWVWLPVTMFVATGFTASYLSERARREVLNAEERRVEAEAANQRFADVVKTLEGVVWEADPETFAFSFVSGQAERMLGFPTQRWLREPTFWRDHVHPEDRERAAALRREAATAQRPLDHEYRMFAADGRAVWMRELVSPPVEDGPSGQLRGLVIDITERKRAEIMLRRQANLLEQTHDAVFVWEFPGTIVDWNRGAERLYGYSRDEAIGHPPHEFLRTTYPMPTAAFDALLERDGAWSGELTHVTRDGRAIVLESRHVLMREPHGRRLVLETNRDITDRKAAEEALQRAQAALTHATRVTTLGEVTASFAHELNQPLGAISNNANACLSLLAAGRVDVAECQDALRDIVDDAARASAIIDRVRALAKQSMTERVPVRFADVVADVVALAATESAARRVAIRLDVPADLPVVVGDRVQLQQVLLNLVVNAMDAMASVEESERHLYIRGRPDTDGGRPAVTVLVEDEGIGLRSEDMGRLFEAFYTTKAHGMGLGLAISRSIVEAHGGRLWAEAKSERGTIFAFRLPAMDATPAG